MTIALSINFDTASLGYGSPADIGGPPPAATHAAEGIRQNCRHPA